MSVLDVLKSARAKLAKGYIRNIDRHDNDDGTVSYCAVGALLFSSPYHCFSNEAFRLLENEIPTEFVVPPEDWVDQRTGGISRGTDFLGSMLASYNNLTDQARVLALFDAAIAKLEPPTPEEPPMEAKLMVVENWDAS